MKRLLIIGAGTEQIAVIEEAKKMGHYVIVTDFNPKAPGIPFADKFVLVSTTDGPGNVQVGKSERIDGVLTVCSETAVPTVAFVADKLNLPSFSPKTALLATNKKEMRQALQANNVRVSTFLVSNSFQQCINYFNTYNGPWVIKPVDSSGQRGTNIVYNHHKLEATFNLAVANSYTGEALIDQFITGPEIHVTMHIINGQVNYLAITDRITLDKQNFGIAIRHVGPSILDSKVEEEVKKLCENGVQAIELENGVATCEIVIQNGVPYVMELAVRVPGGYLREVASLLSGVDINKTTIWTSLGENKPMSEITTEAQFPAVSVKFLSVSNLDSSIKTIASPPDYSSLVDGQVKLVNFHFDKDFEVPELTSSVARFGAVIAIGNTPEEAVSFTEKVFNEIKIESYSLKEYLNYNPNNKNFKPKGL
jgi:biotin carboxylase